MTAQNYSAPTCGKAEARGNTESTSAPSVPQKPAGTKAVAKYLGDALRHTRHAAGLNLAHGPSGQVVASVRLALDALDGAAFVCDYAEAER